MSCLCGPLGTYLGATPPIKAQIKVNIKIGSHPAAIFTNKGLKNKYMKDLKIFHR